MVGKIGHTLSALLTLIEDRMIRMKNLIKNIILGLFRFLNLFINYDTVEKIRAINRKIFSLWLRWYFIKCENSTFYRPIYIKGPGYISLGDNFISGPHFKIEAWGRHNGEEFHPQIIIGKNVSFSSNCHIGAINKIIIKDNVLFGSNVFITDHSHGETVYGAMGTPPSKRKLFSKGPVIIEENVWVGENVTILPGVTIGYNSIIGANSVVTKSVPQNVVAAGNPAVVIKQLT
jgi:acetyltransferase-like isoleucine patch superfamily enzyme